MKKSWVWFVSKRLSRVDSKGKSLVTSVLSVLGISFGVMTLIVVLGVMNGFQRTYIDAILELSSYHIQAESHSGKDFKEFEDFLDTKKDVRSHVQFIEGQSLVTSDTGRESVALIRAVSENVYGEDPAFRKELNLVAGSWDLEPGNIVIGSVMARDLSVRVGSKINFFALSGNDDVELLSKDRIFTVSGIYKSGYSDINQTYVFIGYESGLQIFGENSPVKMGIKLKNENYDSRYVNLLRKTFPEIKVSSWRQYNKSFFGALRVEKNILTLLVLIIFLVVGINIFNGMRRLVYERKTEISLLSALGARTQDIKNVFIMRGFITGIAGSLSGLVLGLLISLNSTAVFSFTAKVLYWIQYFFTSIFNSKNLMYMTENTLYSVYAKIPSRLFPGEVIFITLFGLFSPVIASALAGKNVLKMAVSEVLHAE